MDIVEGDFQFPINESPVPIHRQFPDAESVDGFATNSISLVRIPCTNPERYSFSVWSPFERMGFRTTPRQDIDLKLAQLNLPPSDYLLRNHQIVKQDDLDKHLDYRDPNSYGFVVEIDRSEAIGYYKLITTSPFLQDNYNAFGLVWIWRDLPIDCEDDYNFLLYHYPEDEYDIGAPVTRAEMLDIFREAYPDAKFGTRLRVLVDSNSGEYGNMLIVEDFGNEDDEDEGRLRLGRAVYLDPSEFIVISDSPSFIYGFVPNPYREIDSTSEENSPSSEHTTDNGPESSLNYNLFGDPDQEIYVDDLIGPDFDPES